MSLMQQHHRTPRIGFLGLGWIGLQRMRAAVESEQADVVAVADTDARRCAEAIELAPSALLCTPETIYDLELDGLVIATPSALHAEQTIQALRHGFATFCQKPLGRSAPEVEEVLRVAERYDKLLAVDTCYRHVRAVQEAADLLRSGRLGTVFAVELVFHNAYGPDKDWYYKKQSSGGGCVTDLGLHLVDLLLWLLDYPAVEMLHARTYRHGNPCRSPDDVEDFASAYFTLEDGVTVQLSCSWNLAAGQDAVIDASLYGTEGAVRIRNVHGSFYDFQSEHCVGTQRRLICAGADAWGGKALSDWLQTLQHSSSFDPAVGQALAVHEVLDRIHQAGITKHSSMQHTAAGPRVSAVSTRRAKVHL
ncbi:MAG: Gfo/Idh/MocA family oxidoreductase [Bdellovibrionales bacterium]|nr:Gfo/Idh/MocA family oxidoreductase [Bdellovibrionales bacterium]